MKISPILISVKLKTVNLSDNHNVLIRDVLLDENLFSYENQRHHNEIDLSTYWAIVIGGVMVVSPQNYQLKIVISIIFIWVLDLSEAKLNCFNLTQIIVILVFLKLTPIYYKPDR